MEEIYVSSLVIENGELVITVETKKVPKNRGLKPKYKDIEICNKTPIRIRGLSVEVHRLSPSAREIRTLKEVEWVIKENNKIVSYANEIHLRDASVIIKNYKPVIRGIVISPSDETKALKHIVGFKKEEPEKFFLARCCDKCRERNMIEGNLELMRITPKGVFV